VARATWEGAPRAVRWFLLTGWLAGLGLRLGPRPSPDHVLGWAIESATPAEIVLEARSWLIEGRNRVRVEGTRVRCTTDVRYERRLGRAVWALAVPIHLRMIRYLLERAAGRPHLS
jgi:hypothetical protein